MMTHEKIQEAFENVVKETICLLNEDKEQAVVKLENSERSITTIKSWLETHVNQTNNEIIELNDQLIELNDKQSNLTVAQGKLIEIQKRLNAEKQLITTNANETLESKLLYLDQMEKDNNRQNENLEKSDQKTKSKVSGWFKAMRNEDYFTLFKDYSASNNIVSLLEYGATKFEQSKLSKESRSIDEIKSQINNLISYIQKNNEDISLVLSDLNNIKIAIDKIKQNKNLKEENLKSSEILLNHLRTTLCKFSQLKRCITSSEVYQKKDKYLSQELNLAVCQILKAQKEFFLIKKTTNETIQEAFENVLKETICLLNEDREKAFLKLENSERNITTIESWLEKHVNQTNNEIHGLNDQLIKLNKDEARLTADEGKLIEIHTLLNAEKNGFFVQKAALDNELKLLDQKKEANEKRIKEIEQNKEDARMERKYPGVYNVYSAIRDKNVKKLSFLNSTIESAISTILCEKNSLIQECERVQFKIDLLEKQLNDVENKLEKNTNDKSGIQTSLFDLRKRIKEIEENIKKKGQTSTARGNVIIALKDMHNKFKYLKNLLSIDETDDREIQELVQHIFNAQRKFLELDDI